MQGLGGFERFRGDFNSGGLCFQGLVKRGHGRQHQSGPQGGGHDVLDFGAGRAQLVQGVEGEAAGRNATDRHLADNGPVNALGAGQLNRAAKFGARGKQQIGADGQVRLHAEEENQDGRHERATAHTRQPDHQAHK